MNNTPKTIKLSEVIKYKKRVHVRTFLQNAIRRGDVIKAECCQICEIKTDLDAHHVDYGKPLDVLWLCSKCHGKVHRKNHPLNPANNQQSPMPYIMDRYKHVTVAFTLPVDEFLALKAAADKKKQPVSKLMKKLVHEKYPVEPAQMEFNFEEKKHDIAQSEPNKRIQSLGEDESSLHEFENQHISESRRKRHFRVPGMEQQLFPIFAGNGANATGLQR